MPYYWHILQSKYRRLLFDINPIYKMLHFTLKFPAFIILFISMFSGAFAQYFYKDIWTNQQLTKEFAVLKNENKRTISVKSFEDDGEPSEAFYC